MPVMTLSEHKFSALRRHVTSESDPFAATVLEESLHCLQALAITRREVLADSEQPQTQ